MIIAFSVSTLIDDGALGVSSGLFLLFGWSIGPFCYVLSFLFQFEGNAMLVTFFINVLLGAILPLTVSILRLIESTREVAKVLLWIFRIFPAFSFGFGLLNLT